MHRMTKTHFFRGAMILIILTVLALPFRSSAADMPKYEVGGTNMTQGCYHVTVAWTTILNKYSQKVNAVPKVTTSPTGNIRLIHSGSIPFGYVSEMTCYAALNGLYPFKDPVKSDLRMLFCDQGFMYPILASVDSGIKSVTDLKGRKMAGWSRSSIFGKAVLLATLELYGLKESDVKLIEGKSTGEVKRMLQEGMVDAASFPMTPNSAGVVDLMANKPCIFLPIPKEKVAEIVKLSMDKFNTMVTVMTLPANTYQGQTQEVYFAGSPDGWAGTTNIPDDQAYEIVRTIFDHEEEFLSLQPGKKGLKGVTRETAVSAMFGIPYYPGAVKYFKEKGWWTGGMETKQQKALAAMAKLMQK